MCGIAGFLDRRGASAGDAMRQRVGTMCDRLAHRGPDGEGTWLDPAAGIALGHRRLAIIDPSPRGRQPMVSADGRIVLTYNGEIYNFRDLRERLTAEGHAFNSDSDSEVLCEAIAAWGVEAALAELNGMFAFAAWDRQDRRLVLARDRLGIKPLYWASLGRAVLFASELKALVGDPSWEDRLDPEAISSFLAYGNIAAPRTAYAAARKLEPGTFLVLGDDAAPSVQRYWHPDAVARHGSEAPLELSLDAAAERIEALLLDAVRRQMIADVPLGAFLSGGVDSTLVVALMQRLQSAPVRTFTIGFAEAAYDESPHAARIARHLGTAHEDLRVTPAAAWSVVPRLAEIYDEPFADASQIATILVAAMTRRHVTVALSGDGGDELFAGYNRHRFADLFTTIGRAPAWLRSGAARLITGVAPATWDGVAALLPPKRRPQQLGDKLYKLATTLSAETMEEAYDRLTALGLRQMQTGDGGAFAARVPADLAARLDPIALTQYLDLTWYLPNDVLTKVDRASMSVGLEVRVPYLDHRLVELCAHLPRALRRWQGGGKPVLRHILDRYVPRQLMARPKAGFAVPIGTWLRGPLRDWAESLLGRPGDDDFVDRGTIAALWTDHLSGGANHEHALWHILMLRSWLENRRQPVQPLASANAT